MNIYIIKLWLRKNNLLDKLNNWRINEFRPKESLLNGNNVKIINFETAPTPSDALIHLIISPPQYRQQRTNVAAQTLLLRGIIVHGARFSNRIRDPRQRPANNAIVRCNSNVRTLGGFQRNARATWLGITECLWRACNRTVAVIDSCEIPAKHNYNNSAAADQRGIGAPVTNYGSNIIMQLYRSRDKSGEGEGGGEDIRRFSFGQFA